MRTAFIVFLGLLLLSLVFGGRGCIYGCGQGYSEGERTGTIMKLSRKGLIIKSWEGSMAMGASAPQGEHAVMQPVQFDFSVTDPAVVEAIKRAQFAGRPVTVTYVQWLLAPINIDSDHVVTGVR